jgi:hypothetical protein
MRSTIPTAALELLQQGEQTHPVLITEADVLTLPEAMQRYLRYVHVVGKEPIQTVRLKQRGFFRTQPGQKWLPMVAEEYFTTNPLAFLWRGKIRLFPFISISAWDRFSNGHGSLLVKLLSLVPLADVHGPEADQGELLRYLGEIIWFPTAWLSDAVEWQAIDAQSVQVTIRQPSVTVSAVLYVNEQGQMTHLTAERSMAERKSYRLERWSAQCHEYQEVSGLLIPTRVEVTWNLASGDFSYFRGEITEIEYNQSGRVTVL